MSYKSLQYLLRKLKVSIFWQMKQKCENLSVTVAMVEIVCNIFLTKLRILQKLILNSNGYKSGLRCPTDTYNNSSESLKCLFFGKLNKNVSF